MKVKDLKAQLFYLPDDMDVILAKDEEGNGFYYLQEVEEGHVLDNDDYEAEYIHPDDLEDYEDETKKAVILWP